MRPPGWFRLMRAGLFAVVCVGLSQAGHDLMAPRPVPAWSVGVALGLVVTIGYRLAGRERSLGWILGGVETIQLYLHMWFSWTTPSGTSPDVVRLGDAPLMMPGHMESMAVTHGGMSTPMMFAAHALAGAFVAVWLAVGERALWRTLRALSGILSSHLGWLLALVQVRPLTAGPASIRPIGQDDAAPPAALLRHTLARRGPPSAAHARDHVIRSRLIRARLDPGVSMAS
ncbi:hypothetical protein GCM10023194_29140 [Planotetraspora phitsanulokensis]|uniref:Uncharacterized protein n=1 Tax=Planotetraspora phitsanulokensis TaxID=575192 RepID=A0A8J3TZM9_9ACTN|nr:hypothetical protein [Planotetraspora phitsanulokensis]GII35948.1 hypothetical protein Pph01_09510 [Planotetraspora phitsanulokensis]